MALSRKARAILNDSSLIEKRDMWFERLTDLFEGRPNSWNDRYLFALSGVNGIGKSDMYTAPEKWVEEALEDLADRLTQPTSDACFCPPCIEAGFYGVHYIDKMLGANVFFKDDQWNVELLKTPVGTLSPPDLESSPIWDLSRRAALAFLEADVRLPLFGLPTIASVLNIAVNLYSEAILVDMLMEPDNAKKDMDVICDLLCMLHRWYRDTLPESQLQPVVAAWRTQPWGYGQICGCTTQLVSGELYREMIAPYDVRVLNVYPHGGMIHLCGAHEQHIPVFRDMKSLRSVQVNDRAARSLEKYFTGLRDDQIIYLNPCKEMTLEEAMEITGGDRVIYVGRLDTPVEKAKYRHAR